VLHARDTVNQAKLSRRQQQARRLLTHRLFGTAGAALTSSYKSGAHLQRSQQAAQDAVPAEDGAPQSASDAAAGGSPHKQAPAPARAAGGGTGEQGPALRFGPVLTAPASASLARKHLRRAMRAGMQKDPVEALLQHWPRVAAGTQVEQVHRWSRVAGACTGQTP